jgi:hypothetical protein
MLQCVFVCVWVDMYISVYVCARARVCVPAYVCMFNEGAVRACVLSSRSAV